MKLYVANLSYSTTDGRLRQAFELYGEVTSAKIVMDRDTGRSRGFGFVDMPDESAARRAIQSMAGAELDGRALKVTVSTLKDNGARGYNADRRRA